LLDVAHSFSPWVEDTSDDTVLLDLSGLERLYGAHARMARELSARTTAIGLESNIAIAANPDAARHASRGFTGITVIPDGKEAQRLAVLPIPILLEGFASAPKQATQKSARDHEKRCDQILDTLERWGVRDFRTLALLPEHALRSRLGEPGISLHRLARGAATRTLALCQPALTFEETQELDSPVETLEPLSFILNRLLQQLCARLEARALAVQKLQLELQLERRIADEENLSANELAAALAPHNIDGVPLVRRTLQLPVAMRDPKVFLKLLQLDLDAHPPGAPVILLRVIAEPAPPRTAQCGLFLSVSPEAEKLEITLARIGGIVGERRVGIARLLDTHRREGFSMSRFLTAESSPPARAMPETSELPAMALRMFRPPQRLSVQTAEQKPVTLTPAENFRDRTMVQGKIVWSAGPWRSSGDWWTEKAKPNADENVAAPFDREEWDIALSHPGNTGIALYRIYRDLGSGSWFADARYD
jgi:protein ImuB